MRRKGSTRGRIAVSICPGKDRLVVGDGEDGLLKALERVDPFSVQ